MTLLIMFLGVLVVILSFSLRVEKIGDLTWRVHFSMRPWLLVLGMLALYALQQTMGV